MAETAENLCLGFGCRGKGFFAKVSIGLYLYEEPVFQCEINNSLNTSVGKAYATFSPFIQDKGCLKA